MNRPTFVTMSTLVFTLVAYATLAQTASAGETPASAVVAAMERVHVQGK